MKKPLPIIITTVLLAISGGIIADFVIISDQELQDYILIEAVNGREPVINASRVDLDRIVPAYLRVIEELGGEVTSDDVAAGDFNLYNKVRREAVKQNYDVKAVEGEYLESLTLEEYMKMKKEFIELNK